MNHMQSRSGWCQSIREGGDVAFVVVGRQRHPQTATAAAAHDAGSSKSLRNFLQVVALGSQRDDVQ